MKKQILYLLTLMAFVITMISFVSALTVVNTFTAPTSGTNYTSPLTITVNTMEVAPGGNQNMTNVSCYYNSSGGKISTSGVYSLAYMINSTKGQTLWTTTASLSDSATYNISCLIQNQTTLNQTLYANHVAIDNTGPVITFDVKEKNVNPNGVIEAKCSYTDATTGTTAASNLSYKNPAGVISTLTADGTYQAVKDASTSMEGNYLFTCYAADYSGNKATSTSTSTVQGFTITTNSGTSTGGNSNLILLIIAGLAIYYFATKK